MVLKYTVSYNNLRLNDLFNFIIIQKKNINCIGPPFDAGTDLERQNARLIYENQQLNEENSELLSIVKEYENTLQVMMNKFRVQSVRYRILFISIHFLFIISFIDFLSIDLSLTFIS